MMKKLTLLFYSTVLVVSSCNQKAKEDKKDPAALYAESMKMHDAIMPRMDTLFTLRQQLSLKLDSLKSDSVSQAALIEEVRNGIQELVQADKAMMDWMHNIKEVPGSETTSGHHHGGHDASAENVSGEEVLKTQQQQREAIEKVRKDMEESVANARRLLRKK